MLADLFSIIVIVLLGSIIGWSKYKKHKKPEKYWEGHDPNERVLSTEELRQNELKYRGFPQIGGPGGM